jgi:ABC-2 type transport system permease protein
MTNDILTVMWKEAKRLFCFRADRTSTVASLLIPAATLGLYLPLQIGRALVEGPWSLLAAVFVPMMLVGMAIPESFAGERERHTLGTLLASRLPQRAILLGKVAVAVGYAWGMALLLLLVSLVMVNVVHWDGQVLLYTPIVLLANVTVSLLVAAFVAGLGVLISMRASTVQRAQQELMGATLLPLVLLQMVPLLLLKVVPNGRARLETIVLAANPTQTLLVALAILVVLDVGLLLAAMARFQRARLILD